ncbi:hypothetical protein PoB_001260200 [Plakobranchus ocellatus]|uniref:Uncharacterized protein n=1 Tax=Plakobranchus ocellatus TaxID=259542 RepID=A0AAV3YUE5_9GAST|nr:hypothetical protein PoB_001260200 [Plakobranchus ocellatus]
MSPPHKPHSPCIFMDLNLGEAKLDNFTALGLIGLDFVQLLHNKVISGFQANPSGQGAGGGLEPATVKSLKILGCVFGGRGERFQEDGDGDDNDDDDPGGGGGGNDDHDMMVVVVVMMIMA